MIPFTKKMAGILLLACLCLRPSGPAAAASGLGLPLNPPAAEHGAPAAKPVNAAKPATGPCPVPAAKFAARPRPRFNLNPEAAPGRETLENEQYRIEAGKDGELQLTVKSSGTSYSLLPEFTLLYRADDPGLKRVSVKNIAFQVPGWKAPGTDSMITDLFRFGEARALRAENLVWTENGINWEFPEVEEGRLTASLTLPAGKADPRINYHFTAAKRGWFSVGYTGMPAIAAGELDELFQPLVWQEKRMPQRSFLSAEYMCSIPAVLVSKAGHTLGVVADPAEIPFRFQQLDDSGFGVALRSAEGEARPMIFAPFPGQQRSMLQQNSSIDFSFRLIAREGAVFDTYRYIAQNLLGFHDYRKNAGASLNETIGNMISYAMNDYYSGWDAELKAPDYSTDVKGTVKLVSALHPLSLALITDDKQIYTRRALPMMEYLMSREKYLFSVDTSAKHQSPSHFLKGPSAEVSELAALYDMTRGRSSVFKHYATELYGKPRVLNLDMVSEGASWQSALAFYRMSGDRKYLEDACRGADEYIAARISEPQTDFSDVHIPEGGQFWTDFSPKWIDLLELYEETKTGRYLEAATRGAQLFVEYIWMQPTPPDTLIRVHEGGKAGTFAYQNRNNPNVQPMPAPEQMVPAWRVAQTGLISEASTTYTGNRAIFLSHYAAYLLRLAHYTGESFFHDIARSAIVGRYTNFPGYSIMGEYSTVYSRPDYPLKSLNEITYNNIYYNHIWPHIALLMDFLVSDAFTRSGGKINFPHQYAQGYAYLQSKVYGDRSGEFYGDKDVRLWMPEDLLRVSSIQGNYLTAYGNGNLYVALMNQSAADTTITLSLNPDLVPFEQGKTYKVRLWQEDARSGDAPSENTSPELASMKNGRITVPLEGGGITALAIEGLPVSTQFQQAFFPAARPLSEKSYAVNETPMGNITGMILSMGASLSNGYVWLEATEKELQQVSLSFMRNGQWQEITDTRYPFEFSVPLLEDEKIFEYRVSGKSANGKPLKSGTVNLEF